MLTLSFLNFLNFCFECKKQRKRNYNVRKDSVANETLRKTLSYQTLMAY